jgi:hypothetical protein
MTGNDDDLREARCLREDEDGMHSERNKSREVYGSIARW